MRRIGLLAVVAAVILPLSALAQTSGYYDRSYTRMSYVQGDVYVQRAQDLGYEQGQVNLVVIEGDKLGTRAGRLEIQLGLRNYLRLDNDTQVEVAALPDGDGLPTKLHILGGGMYLRVSTLDVEKGYEIHTPDASFYVLREGLYRVDVRPSRETELSVYEGAVEAAGQEGSRVVEERQRISASDGRFVSEPFSLIARRDDFSSWNDSREALFARGSSRSASYLPAEYSDYGYELDSYGSWVDEADYGYVWVPRVIDPVWRPYSSGRWVWYPIIGWTWVSYDPWGWCTHHYGRWGWRLGLGWYWIPRDHWSWGPAWVNWWYDGDYIGWCALSYYNRPAVIINNFFYDRHSRNDFRSFGRTLNVVRRDQLQDRNLRSVAVGADRFANRSDGITFRGDLADVRPSGRGDAMVNARASEAFSGRNARAVQGGYADNGRRLSAGEIRSSGGRGDGTSMSGAGSRVIRDGASARSEGAGRTMTGRTQDAGVGIDSRSGSAGRAGAGDARTIRSYPSQGDRGASSGTVRRNEGSGASSSSRPGVSSGSARVRESGSGSTSGTSANTSNRRSGDESARTIRAYPSSGASSRSAGVTSRSSSSSSTGRTSSRASGSSMREYPSGSSSRSSGVTSRPATGSTSSPSRSPRSSVSSREYPSSSSGRSSAPPRSSSSSRISSAPSRSSVSSREYPSSSLSRSTSSPRSSSSSSSRSYSAPSSRSSSTSSAPSRSYATPRSSSSSSSRSYSAPSSRSSSTSSAPSRSTSSPRSSSSSSSRSYSAPSSRSSSSYSAPSRSYSTPRSSSSSSSRSYSAPRASSSSSSSSRSYSAPSRSSSSSSGRSSSGGSVSRSSGSSARSSSGSSRRR